MSYVDKAITLLTETGINIHSITFDSVSVNISMVKLLGADFEH